MSRPNEYTRYVKLMTNGAWQEIGIMNEDISPEKRRLIEDELMMLSHSVVLQVYSLRDEYGYIYIMSIQLLGKRTLLFKQQQ